MSNHDFWKLDFVRSQDGNSRLICSPKFVKYGFSLIVHKLPLRSELTLLSPRMNQLVYNQDIAIYKQSTKKVKLQFDSAQLLLSY